MKIDCKGVKLDPVKCIVILSSLIQLSNDALSNGDGLGLYFFWGIWHLVAEFIRRDYLMLRFYLQSSSTPKTDHNTITTFRIGHRCFYPRLS
jgi:hypothetical protein